MPASPIRMLSPLADAAKAGGAVVHHLNIGQPDLETPAVMRSRLAKLDAPVLAYTPSGGTPDYLAFLRSYYGRLGIPLRLGDFTATAGGSEALLFAFMALAEAGDDLMVVEPFYTNYRTFAEMAGVRLVALASRVEDGFHLPPAPAWEAALTPRTRAVVLCNPNNPTGTVYTGEELRFLADFCKRRDLFLISDEVYREFAYDGRKAMSALQLEGIRDRVVVVDSLSKRYSACGIRLGALITRNPEISNAALHMAQGRLSAPGLAQAIAPAALELGPDYYAAMAAEYEARRDLLYAGLSAIPGVFLAKPEGAFYCIARLPVEDAEDFCRWLLTDFRQAGKTVMLAPAAGFYASPGLGRDEVRIAYVLSRGELAEALACLRAALERYAQRGGRRLSPAPPVGEKRPDFHPAG